MRGTCSPTVHVFIMNKMEHVRGGGRLEVSLYNEFNNVWGMVPEWWSPMSMEWGLGDPVWLGPMSMKWGLGDPVWLGPMPNGERRSRAVEPPYTVRPQVWGLGGVRGGWSMYGAVACPQGWGWDRQGVPQQWGLTSGVEQGWDAEGSLCCKVQCIMGNWSHGTLLNRMTGTTENITFPQLRWQAVNISESTHSTSQTRWGNLSSQTLYKHNFEMTSLIYLICI